MSIVRCRKCRRPFSAESDQCPECQTRSPKGVLRLVTKVASVVVATVALVFGTKMGIKGAREAAAEHRASPAELSRSTLPPGAVGGTQEIQLDRP